MSLPARPGDPSPTADIVTPKNNPHPPTMIKALTILLGLLAMTATADAHGGKGKGGRQPDAPADLLAKYDKNRDGKLDEAELATLTPEDRAALEQHRKQHRRHGKGKGKGKCRGKGDGRDKPAGV